MGRQKAPAYQRYPKQIMGDDKVLLMDWDAYGMHNWLLDISWQQDPRGTIPDDEATMRCWLRRPDDDTWSRVWPQISPAWPTVSEGRRGNWGMIECAERQANYSNGNKGKGAVRKSTANSSQICEQFDAKYDSSLVRKSIEDEDVIIESSLNTEIAPKFSLDEFDPDTEFAKLCKVYPKPNRGILGLQAYQRAIEGAVSLKRPDRKSIAESIQQAATDYRVAKCNTAPKYIPELTSWLDKGIWQQDPSCWDESGSNVSPIRPQSVPSGRPEW